MKMLLYIAEKGVKFNSPQMEPLKKYEFIQLNKYDEQGNELG